MGLGFWPVGLGFSDNFGCCWWLFWLLLFGFVAFGYFLACGVLCGVGIIHDFASFGVFVGLGTCGWMFGGVVLICDVWVF